MPFSHLNILFLLGLVLFGGTIGGRLFQKFHIPQVVGYIIIGIVIGQSGLKIMDKDILEVLQPFNYFALGLIGFMIGGELKKKVFSKYGKQFMYILLSEGLGAFLVVFLLVGILGSFFLNSPKIAWALALLLGAIASATAPAATTEVLREHKTRGPLTTTILGIVALDDGLALLLFAIASSIAARIIGQSAGGLFFAIIHPIYEIAGSVIIGILLGFVLTKILKRYSEKERLLAFCIGIVLLTIGLSLVLRVNMLLAAMTLGVVVINFTPRKSKQIFKLVEGFTPPIYVLFFVLVGARLDISYMKLPILLLVGIYLVGTTMGKMIGSKFGTRLSNAQKTVKQYLPMCLFCQAGVAIGLSILAAHLFPGEIGNAVVIIVTAAVFILEIIGPPLVKIAVTKAGEVGLNITEEDLIEKTKAADMMDTNPPLIYEGMQLTDILKIFSESANLYYPVINKNKELCGIITVDGIKQTLMERDLSSGLILAADLMEPVVATINPEVSMPEVKELLERNNLEYLPVVTEENRITGFIERRMLDKFISRRIIELQKQASFLEEAK